MMPANTTNEMLWGLIVILVILLIYTLSLYLRTLSAKSQQTKNQEK